MRRLLASSLLACSLALAATSAGADILDYKPRPPLATTANETAHGAAELARAIRARNANAVAKVLRSEVAHEGLWFPDRTCAKRFAKPGTVRGKVAINALARCLSRLVLQTTTRESGMSDAAVLTFVPGVELEVAFSRRRVRWLGFAHQRDLDRGIPTLTAQAFEALRKTGTTQVDAVVREQLDPEIERLRGPVSAWIKICLDETGAITSATARGSSNPTAAKAFEEVARTWTFRPFKHRGTAVPACSLSALTYPADQAPAVETLPDPDVRPAMAAEDVLLDRIRETAQSADFDDLVIGGVFGGQAGGVYGGVLGGTLPPPPPPPPPAPPRNVPPTLLEANRLRGNKTITPDASTRQAMVRAGKSRVVTSWKVCIDSRGKITRTSKLKSSGFADYDRKIARGIATWRYRPYRINGKAVAVCTAVTFIYSPSP